MVEGSRVGFDNDESGLDGCLYRESNGGRTSVYGSTVLTEATAMIRV